MGATGRPSNTFQKTYYRAWWGTIQTFDLNPTESLFMFLVDSLSSRTGWCYASKKTIASVLNITEATVYNTQKILINKGLLEKSYAENNYMSLNASGQPSKENKYKKAFLRPSDRWTDFIRDVANGHGL